MHFLDAVLELFAKTNGPLTTSQIAEGLLGGGFSSDSDNPKKVIAAQLHRYAANDQSGIVRLREACGRWIRQGLGSLLN